MREAYRPQAAQTGIPQVDALLQRQSDDYYALAGIETELLLETAGYRLAVFERGEEVQGGLAALGKVKP